MATATVKIELMLASPTWTDVTADCRWPLSIRYGMTDGLPTTRVAASGQAIFTLNNSVSNSGGKQGYYAPNNANCRTGFAQNIPVRISFTSSAIQYFKFLGRVRLIVPQPGLHLENNTICTATDYMDDLARVNLNNLPPVLNTTFDVALAAVVNAMPYAPVGGGLSYQSGISSLPYAIIAGANGLVNGLQEAQRLAISEFGYIYQDGSGFLRAENRHSRPVNATSLYTIHGTAAAPEMLTVTVPSDVSNLINRVQVTVHPRRVDAASVTLYAALSQPQIPAGATLTLQCPYSDPTLRASKVSGVRIDPPIFSANSRKDGTGTDLTSTITLSTVNGGTGATLTFTNTGANPAYITAVTITGIGLYDYDNVVSISDNAASQAAYGIIPIAIDQTYEISPENAAGVGAYLLSIYDAPFPYATDVTFLANASGTLMFAALSADISSRVTIIETVTGMSADFFINGVSLAVDPSMLITCKWILAPVGPSAAADWQLGVAGKSELGTTTTLWSF